MKSFYKNLIIAVCMVLAAQTAFVSCDDDPGADSYYTTKAEYAADFLKNREKFSEFTAIVQRSKMLDLLGIWGSYTVFAPTNEAIEEYLHSKGLTSFLPNNSSMSFLANIPIFFNIDPPEPIIIFFREFLSIIIST